MIGEPAPYDMKALALRRRTDLPAGWRPVYERLVERLSSLPRTPGLAVVTMRDGHLHVQLASPDSIAQAMIDEATGECCRTCESCGHEGVFCRSGMNWAVRCPAHQLRHWKR